MSYEGATVHAPSRVAQGVRLTRNLEIAPFEYEHRVCEQHRTCISGSVGVGVDDGEQREEGDHPTREGLHIRSRLWDIQYKFSSHATLFVFVSHDQADDVRSFKEFLAEERGASR